MNSPGSGLKKIETWQKERTENKMVILAVKVISLLLSVSLVGAAVKKWHIIRDRRQILSVIKNALKQRKAFVTGIITAIFYLAIFMILGGKGGRIHVLFGRVVWNTTLLDLATGALLTVLVFISMSLFVSGMGIMGVRQSGRKNRMGFFGSVLALLAAFCP